jgi:hypothetical protein
MQGSTDGGTTWVGYATEAENAAVTLSAAGPGNSDSGAAGDPSPLLFVCVPDVFRDSERPC